MKIKNIFCTMVAAGISCVVQAQDLPLDPAVRTGKLANGFTYFIRHNEEPKNRVTFYLANKVGSILEDDDQRGLAHFIEHMSFNGTKHYPKNELVDYLQKTGVRFGADLNAYTGFDETVYQLPLPSDRPDIVKHGLQIMRDWAQEATLDPGEIDKERGVVLEEKRLGKGAGERMQRIYYPLLLNNSVYASRLPIGTDEVLNNFKPEVIKRFYHDWYRPDLQALIVVGDVDAEAMEKDIRLIFGDLRNPKNERLRPQHHVPLTGKNQFIVVTDREMTGTSVQVVMKQPELQLHTAREYRESIIHQLHNSMLSERYADLQRLPDPPFLQGEAGTGGFIGGLDNYTVSVTAKPGQLETGFKAAWRVNEQVRRFGFTSTELDRVKVAYLNQLEQAFKEKSKTRSDSYVREYLQYFLHGTASPGISYEYELVKAVLPGISLEEINAYAGTTVKTVDRDIIIMAPAKDRDLMPTESIFNSWIKAVDEENMTAYHDENSKADLLKKQPVPGKIVKQEYDASLNISILTLSNGVKVLLKPTDFKNDEILFSGWSAGGTSLYRDEDFQSANAANIVPSFGAGNYNNATLSKYLSGKQFSVHASIGERTQGIGGGASVSDLSPALEMVYAYFTEPRKDTSLFRSIMSRSRAGLANRENDPGKVFGDTVAAVLGNYSVRRTGPTLNKLDQIDLERAFDIFKDRFSDASGFTFVFTGSIDTVRIRPLLEKYIASLPSSHKNEQARDLHINIPEGRITKIVYKGTEPKAMVNLVLSGPFDYNFENNLKMDALKECIQIRLIERLREDESGVYSPRVQVITTKYPQGRFNLNISFGCAPQNVEKLIASTRDEISKLQTNGPPGINLEKFKAENRRTLELQLKSNDFWLGYLSSQSKNNEAIGQITRYIDISNEITTTNVKEMAVKYLNGKNFISLISMPEKSK